MHHPRDRRPEKNVRALPWRGEEQRADDGDRRAGPFPERSTLQTLAEEEVGELSPTPPPKQRPRRPPHLDHHPHTGAHGDESCREQRVATREIRECEQLLRLC